MADVTTATDATSKCQKKKGTFVVVNGLCRYTLTQRTDRLPPNTWQAEFEMPGGHTVCVDNAGVSVKLCYAACNQQKELCGIVKALLEDRHRLLQQIS